MREIKFRPLSLLTLALVVFALGFFFGYIIFSDVSLKQNSATANASETSRVQEIEIVVDREGHFTYTRGVVNEVLIIRATNGEDYFFDTLKVYDVNQKKLAGKIATARPDDKLKIKANKDGEITDLQFVK